MKWIKKYSEYKKLNYVEGNTNGQRWFTLSEVGFVSNDLVNNNTDIDF